MMRLLLDTHILLWWVMADRNLSKMRLPENERRLILAYAGVAGFDALRAEVVCRWIVNKNGGLRPPFSDQDWSWWS